MMHAHSLFRQSNQRGNAILISLIVMASALTISLGLTTVVAGEIRNASLVPSSERAYYKAESQVEQALWNRKVRPDYNVESVSGLANTFSPSGRSSYVCEAASCFTKTPDTHPSLLTEFRATASSFTGPSRRLKQDTEVLELEAEASPGDLSPTARLTLDGVKNAEGTSPADFKGVEVTIVGYSKTSGIPRFGESGPSGEASTPVYVDKRVIKPPIGLLGSLSPDYILGATQNKISPPETSPPFSTSRYRIRIKALGTDAELNKPKVTTSSGAEVTLRAANFAVRAVAEDGKSRRGIQVVTPVREQAASIFDFVLFSDLDLNKLEAKRPAQEFNQVIETRVKKINPRPGAQTPPCTDPSEPYNGIPVWLNGGTQKKVSGESDGNATALAAFTELIIGVNYYTEVFPKAEWEVCPPPIGDPKITPAEPGTPLGPNELRKNTFVLRPVCKLVNEPYTHFHELSRVNHTHTYTETHLDVERIRGGQGSDPFRHLHPPRTGDHFGANGWHHHLDSVGSNGWRFTTWRHETHTHSYNETHTTYGNETHANFVPRCPAP